MQEKNQKNPLTSEETSPNSDSQPASPESVATVAFPAELAQLREKLLRAAADLENLKKQHARDREEWLRYGNAALISNLLPVVDNFEIALRAAEEHHPEAKMIIEGLGLIIPQLLRVLKEAGVEPIAPREGEDFDPNLHQSVGMAPSETLPAHSIHTLQRTGYRLSERILRPAMVLLSAGKVEGK